MVEKDIEFADRSVYTDWMTSRFNRHKDTDLACQEIGVCNPGKRT
jgi:hypothetical protein